LKTKYEFSLSGGLGNQLFIFYAAIYFQEKHRARVSFDISDLLNVEILHPGINVFDLGFLKQEMISKELRISRDFPGRDKLIRVSEKMKYVLGFVDPRVYKISEVGYFNFSHLPCRTKRIEGYFQSWRYFSELNSKPILNPDLIARPSDWFQQQRFLLEKNEFAALHVRRGDYKLSKNRKNGLLSPTYYLSVINNIPSDMEILVFTDEESDIWEELNSLAPRLKVMRPPENSDPIESLILMSLASHIAIANSTFSWWAAMIAQVDTVVYAPKKWFEIGDDPVDLLPQHWIKIPSDWINQN
jgi:hypothetical protein